MDVVLLSRLQFAVAAMFHFLFVPLTLGLALIIAIIETIYVRTGDEKYKRMAKFWGRIFIVNFAVGVVTGLTLEFQFGTNWSEYSKFVGDVFGSLLAIEATVAFFLESTFLAVWIFGWERISPKLHALSIWIVALASTVSAFWILAANSFMQHPVGYEINPETGRAMLTDFFALISSPTAINAFLHTVAGSFILSGFFVMGVSAYHLMKNNNREIFLKSARIGMYFALVFSLFEVVQGHVNGAVVAEIQPTKLAAMEALWETSPEGEGADQTLVLIPDEKNERNVVEFIKIPNALSLLAYHRPDAEVKGLKEWPKDERPPVLISFLAFRAMVGLGFLFIPLALLGLVYYGPDRSRIPGYGLLLKLRARLERYPRLPWIFILIIPLPYLALQFGWILTEVGRQPWIVYGKVRTAEAASTLAESQVWTTLVGFILVYAFLGLVNFYLIYRFARRGPEEEAAGRSDDAGVEV